jgi:hypothetical protein
MYTFQRLEGQDALRGNSPQTNFASSAIYSSGFSTSVPDDPSLGINWELVSKPPGSRVAGFQLLRERLIATSGRTCCVVR